MTARSISSSKLWLLSSIVACALACSSSSSGGETTGDAATDANTSDADHGDTTPSDSPSDSPSETSSDAPVGCVPSGGSEGTATCCSGAADFPNNCMIGACGCAPSSSKTIKVCNCPSGKCFDGVSCVAR